MNRYHQPYATAPKCRIVAKRGRIYTDGRDAVGRKLCAVLSGEAVDRHGANLHRCGRNTLQTSPNIGCTNPWEQVDKPLLCLPCTRPILERHSRYHLADRNVCNPALMSRIQVQPCRLRVFTPSTHPAPGRDDVRTNRTL